MTDSHMPKPRLWVLPWGLYPRRITIYLKEKGILDDFDVVPVKISQNGQEPSPGKPTGSMPILELSPPTTDADGTAKNDGRYIHQSRAILEYLEDIYGPTDSSSTRTRIRDMRGATAEERARVREMMDVLEEGVSFFGVYVHQASKLFEGMEGQSAEAARAAKERMERMFDLLEAMAERCGGGLESWLDRGPWLAGGGEGPTILDCVGLATVQFAREVYRVDLVKGRQKLGRMCEVFETRESSRMEEIPMMVRELAPQLSVR